MSSRRPPQPARPWFVSPLTLAVALPTLGAVSATFSYMVRWADGRLMRSWIEQVIFEELWWLSYVPFFILIFTLARRLRLDSDRPRIGVILAHVCAAIASSIGRVTLGVLMTFPVDQLPVVPFGKSILIARTLNAYYLFGFLDFCMFWGALGCVYAFDAYTARTRQFAVRTEIGSALATDASVRVRLQSCADAIERHLDIAFVHIWVFSPTEGALELEVGAGGHADPDGALAHASTLNPVIDSLARRRTPHVTNAVSHDPLLPADARVWARTHRLVGLAGCPLVVGDTAIGLLAVFSHTPLSLATTDTLSAIADMLAYGIQRARGDAALRQSEAFLAQAQHLSSTGSFMWRVDTDMLAWSEEMYNIFEIGRDRPLSLDLLRARIHPDDLAAWSDVTRQARAATAFVHDYRLLMPDGSVKYIHAVAHATPTADGQLEYIGACQDVSHHRRSEQMLDRLRAEMAHVARATSLGLLTASIAHEINQPLSGIVTNAGTCLRMLDAARPDLDGARETARRTIRDGNRASAVITRLRALFGGKEIVLEPVDLNEATREVVALSSGDLQRHRVVLRTDLADDLPAIQGDRIQLQQVILNLLRNALDAMADVHDRPRQLLIRTARDGGVHVRLSVSDAGHGFTPGAADKMFDAFYTTKSDGMGIGLSVSRSIVERHQGRLWAESNDGPGATVSFSIPLDSDTKVL